MQIFCWDYFDLKQQKEWLDEYLGLHSDTAQKKSVYYHNGKSKPLSSPVTANGVLLGKSPSVDELINALLVVKDKHIHSFPYKEQSVENLRMALEIIKQDALFEVTRITVGQKVDQRIRLVVQQVCFPDKVLAKEQNNPFEGVKLDVVQSVQNDVSVPNYEEQVLAELRREVQQGLDNEPKIVKRQVKRSKGLRYE